jgi:hypothetical protein
MKIASTFKPCKVDEMVQISVGEQARQDPDQVQLVREIINANLQKHSDYCEGQFQVLFDKVKLLSTSMEQDFKRIDMELSHYREQRLTPLQDAEDAVASAKSLSSFTSFQLATFEAQRA